MKKILPVILNEILIPVASNLLRFIANKIGRKKKAGNTGELDKAVTADCDQTGTAQ